MTLNEKINTDIVTSMKEKDTELLSVLRMVKGAIQLEKINKKRDLEDNEVIAIISKQIKMRNDSIIEFEKASRTDLIEQNKKEIELLNRYMPEQLTNDELNKIIDEAFIKINPSSIKEMGLIMKEITPKVVGKADMKEVNQLIRNKLENN